MWMDLSLLEYMGQGVIILLGSSFSIFAVFNPLSPEAFCQAGGFLSFFFFFGGNMATSGQVSLTCLSRSRNKSHPWLWGISYLLRGPVAL